MVITSQDILTTDPLRKVLSVRMRVSGAATATSDHKDVAVVHGLPDTGGTILGVYAAAGTKPTGTATALVLDVHKNRAGTDATIFTSTKISFTMTAAGSYSASQTTISAANAKVFNNDVLELDVDSVGDGTAGSDIGVFIPIRIDMPND